MVGGPLLPGRQDALVAAMRKPGSGPMRVGLDVTEPEPLPRDHPLVRGASFLVSRMRSRVGDGAARVRMGQV